MSFLAFVYLSTFYTQIRWSILTLYNIFRLKGSTMFAHHVDEKTIYLKNQPVQSTEIKVENIQALPKQETEPPVIKVELGNEIVFTCLGNFKTRDQFFSWLWKNNSIELVRSNEEIIRAMGSDLLKERNSYDAAHKQQNKNKKIRAQLQDKKQEEEQVLYSEDQVGLLKKKLEFQYRGLLSKSTDTDTTLGIPVLYRFRCKNIYGVNPCQFLHILEYCKEEEGKIFYKHRALCSNHTTECILDQQNIQYNVIMRKIDESMPILEQIIKQDPQIKPKEILQVFSLKIEEYSEDFLYEGLQTKTIRRSIKKYFDNAVAKVKAKLRQQ